MTIGDALRRFRNDFNLTQDDVAKVLEVTRQAYQFYERGKSNPPSQKIVDLAILFDVSTDYLLGLSDVPRLPDTKTLVAAINGAQKILCDALDKRND